MRELLERWAEMEPERCDVAHPGSSVSAWVRFPGPTSWSARRIGLDDADPYEEMLLLRAVIEAIEARGWDYRLSSSTPQPGMTHAIVWTGASRPGTRTYRPSHDAHEDTPAAALLGAYLAALEAADADEPETLRARGGGGRDPRGTNDGQLMGAPRKTPSVGPALRARRIALGLTLVEVAKKAGVTEGYLSKVERGIREPGAFTLERILAALSPLK